MLRAMLVLFGMLMAAVEPALGDVPAVPSAVAAAPAGQWRGRVTAEAGVEYDTNINRAQSTSAATEPDEETPRSSPLLRALGSGEVAYFGARQRLRLRLAAGGKVFFLPTAQDQNIGVVQLGYEHGAQLSSVRLLGVVDYYDALQAPATLAASRDFRSLAAGGRLAGSRLLGSAHSLDGALDVGGLFFVYKPDPSLTFIGPTLSSRVGVRLHAGDPDLGHDFDLGLSARGDYRGYLFGRTDVFVQVGGSASWQGPLLVQLGYTAQLNLSNLTTESYQRHLVLAKLAFRLPGELYVTLKGQLNLLQGAPRLFVPVGNIDDDNRSLAMLDIERPLPRGFALSARYTGYFGLPEGGAMSVQYQRHTIYLGMSYALRLPRASRL